MASESKPSREEDLSEEIISHIITIACCYSSEMDKSHGSCTFSQYKKLLRAADRDEDQLEKLEFFVNKLHMDFKQHRDLIDDAKSFYFATADLISEGRKQEDVVVPWKYHGPLLAYTRFLENELNYDISEAYRQSKCKYSDEDEDSDTTEEETEEKEVVADETKQKKKKAKVAAAGDEKEDVAEDNKKTNKAKVATDKAPSCV